jgi:hypothetical protein
MDTQIPASLKPGRCALCGRFCFWRWESPGLGWREEWAKWEEMGEAGKEKYLAQLDAYREKWKSQRFNEITPEEQTAAVDAVSTAWSAKVRLVGEWVCKSCFAIIVGVKK